MTIKAPAPKAVSKIIPAVTLESLGISLKPAEPTNFWRDQKGIITGVPKIGKTTFLAQGGEKTWFFRMAPEFSHIKTVGIDCKDLAKKSGIHRLTIKKMEDVNDGKLSYFKKIFKALGYNKMKIVLWKETPGGTKSKQVEIKV